MGTITESVDVGVDLETAYNQWTQFETFPKFMEGVEQVEQLTDEKLHWVTKIGPVVREFDAVITEQRPDEVIAWHSTDGPDFAGRVTFREIGPEHTQITAEMNVDPEGFVENVGDKVGIIEARVAGDMRRFKEFIESRAGQETGEWRGEIHNGTVTDDGMATGGMANGGMASEGVAPEGDSQLGLQGGLSAADRFGTAREAESQQRPVDSYGIDGVQSENEFRADDSLGNDDDTTPTPGL